VVPLEQADSAEHFPSRGSIAVTVTAPAGAHVRRAGEELRRGDAVLTPPLVLDARRLAAAAAAGHAELAVRRAPRVAVFATGDELVPPGTTPVRGQIPESNSTLLAGLVRSAGACVVRVAALGDDPDALRDEVAGVQASVEVIVCTGGVGAGAYDVVRNAFSDVIAFNPVAMQPGRPQAFGRLPGGPVMFGLPGNPVAAAVSFEAFVRPALARLRGLDESDRTIAAIAGDDWPAREDREQYLPVALEPTPDGRTVARPAGAGRSHFVARLADAEGYAIVPLGVSEVRAGDVLRVLPATI
jgi:molybdopterin molybdotransferase